MLESKKGHRNWFVVLRPSQTDITKSHKSWSRLGSILVDCIIITTTAALAFYQALVSYNAKLNVTGAGFSNQGITESAILLAIFIFGVIRLVLDLRRREDI